MFTVIDETHQASRDAGQRVAVFATDVYTRMRRLQSVRALGMVPRPFSRIENLLFALQSGRRFTMVLATLSGNTEDVLRMAAVLREAAGPGLPMLFVRDREGPDAQGGELRRAPGIDLLTKPFAEEALRARIKTLTTAAALAPPRSRNTLESHGTAASARQEKTSMASLTSSAVVYKSGLPTTRPRIALLEDSPAEAAAFTELLSAHGSDVRCEPTGSAFLGLLRRESFDLLVLDWNLPDMTGFEVLSKVRTAEWAGVPVLMLTARSGELETVQALEAGADDYLAKPWRPFELVARIRVLLRSPSTQMHGGMETHHGFDFHKVSRTVRGHGIEVTLPAKEFDVALLMLRNLGRPLSRERLRETVWHGLSTTGRTIDTHVSRVRSRLGLTLENGFILQSIYGVGYRLERAGEARTET